jgi:hypothetical protein
MIKVLANDFERLFHFTEVAEPTGQTIRLAAECHLDVK